MPDAVYFHIDPSRSAEAALKVFGGVVGEQVLVVDRLSTYKKLARILDGRVILSWCWAYVEFNITGPINGATSSTAPPGRCT